jgi:Cu2+-exporting ATPase
MRQLLNWGSWILTLPVLCVLGRAVLRGRLAQPARARIGMDVPVALGIVITFVASTGATFDPAGPFGHEVYFDSLTMFVSFLLGGRASWRRARATAPPRRWRRAWHACPRRPGVSTPTAGASRQRAALGARRPVRVPVGQAFPADGVLLEGRTQADEALLTGESVPVPKDGRAEVVAGSVNLGAPVLVRVAARGCRHALRGHRRDDAQRR